jgi:transcriptional repressor NF-X1
MKQRSDCSHACSAHCHTGPCPPCTIKVAQPCRCGSRRDLECYVAQTSVSDEILCDRPCTALRACGKHRCNRICCPLAFVGGMKGKGKKLPTEDTVIDEQGWHLCDLVCGKWLTCGNHQCEEREHRGACPPCLRSSFEEVRYFPREMMLNAYDGFAEILSLWKNCLGASDTLWDSCRL